MNVKNSLATYSELARTPKPLNDAHMVDGHRSEEELRGVGVAGLPY